MNLVRTDHLPGCPLQGSPWFISSCVCAFSLSGQKVPDDLDRELAEFYTDLLAKQEPLGKEFEDVLFDNLEDLYERN